VPLNPDLAMQVLANPSIDKSVKLLETFLPLGE
jgi:hypothetical protein